MASLHPENLAERLERAARENAQFGQGGWHRPVLVPPPAPRSQFWPLALLFVVALVLTVALLVIAGMR